MNLSIGDKVCWTGSGAEAIRGTVFRLIRDNVVISWEKPNCQVQYTPDQVKEFISIDYQSIRADKLEQLEI